jgi:glycosyltransferase involved in cell wall biosynthesis
VRVAYVLPSPELNGGNKVIFQHAALLAGRGHQVVTLGEGAAPDWLRLAVPYHDRTAAPPRLPPQDLVIATYWTTVGPAHDLGLGPVAHFCQGYEGGLEHLRPMLPAIEAVYALPLPTLTVSPHLAEMLARRFGRTCRVAPPPLDGLFRPAPRWRPRRRPWIVVPGIFPAAVKDVPTALAAVRLLTRTMPGVRVLRLSTWPLDDEERRLHLPDRYLGAVRPEVVARALRTCDLMLFASREAEGFGLPVLEAMVAGVPVVASRIPSLEGFAQGAAALVPPGDAAAFAAAAADLLASPRAWRRARRAGRAAARRFAPGRVAPVLEEAVAWAGAAGASPGAGR